MWSVMASSRFQGRPQGTLGLDIDRDGRIIAALTDGRAVIAIDPETKAVEVLADTYNGKP